MRDSIDIALAEMERREAAWEAKRPHCCKCDWAIEDEYLWDIDGEIYCDDCAHDLFQHSTEDYMRD